MKFEPGNRLAKGGKRPGAGRKPRVAVEADKSAAVRVREILDRDAEKLAVRYVSRALGKRGDKVLTHAIDKLLPDEQASQIPSLTVNFNHYHNSVSLHAQGLPGAVLGGNGKGRKKSAEGVASEVGQGQNGLEFHHFEDVS